MEARRCAFLVVALDARPFLIRDDIAVIVFVPPFGERTDASHIRQLQRQYIFFVSQGILGDRRSFRCEESLRRAPTSLRSVESASIMSLRL